VKRQECYVIVHVSLPLKGRACVWKLCRTFIENTGLAKLAGVGVLLDLWNVGGWRNLGGERRGGGEPRLANAAGFIWLKLPRTPTFSPAGFRAIPTVPRGHAPEDLETTSRAKTRQKYGWDRANCRRCSNIFKTPYEHQTTHIR
jgi:hypothetical protein